MPTRLVKQSVNIVLRGPYNPALFHPAWFAAKELLGEEEANDARVQVVNGAITQFQCGWLQMHVTQDRFQAATDQDPYHEALRDLVQGVIYLLGNAPPKLMGINRDFFFDRETQESWNGLGNRLTPKTDWLEVLDSPGLLNLEMRGLRPDDLDGYVQVKIAPWSELPYGLFVNVNDHYQLESSGFDGAERAIDILIERWSASAHAAGRIAQHFAELEAAS